jgi:hypothetical protein
MAGMLPGVEFARRRRLRAVGSSAEAPCAGTSRRTSLGTYAAGNGHGHAAAGFPKVARIHGLFVVLRCLILAKFICLISILWID